LGAQLRSYRVQQWFAKKPDSLILPASNYQALGHQNMDEQYVSSANTRWFMDNWKLIHQ